jgi:hypothetical protein
MVQTPHSNLVLDHHACHDSIAKSTNFPPSPQAALSRPNSLITPLLQTYRIFSAVSKLDEAKKACVALHLSFDVPLFKVPVIDNVTN